VVAVQSTGEDRADLLNRQGGRYHVVVRGLAGGVTVDRVEESASVSRALAASSRWPDVLAVARSPDLRWVISNTAETGYALDPADAPDRAPPRSFPAKLLAALKDRFEAGGRGVTILPCELHEHNADLLRGIVLRLAESWRLSPDLARWVETECAWRNTLVDRIVTGKPPEHPLLDRDGLLTLAEPFALWAVEAKDEAGRFLTHPAVRWTEDVQPFFLRKVRILNGAHTAMVGPARARGVATVREAMEDPVMRAWLERLLFEEIVPTLEGRVEDPAGFARQTLERFRNPFLVHKFSDIAVYHEAKVQIRLVPTRAEFIEKFGRRPLLLDEVLGTGGG
jgi:tagaturonate reductase